MTKELMQMNFSIEHITKGLGYEKWIVNKKEYCGKLLFIKKGKKCSWHYHILKDETFYLHSGKIMLYYSDNDDFLQAKSLILNPGDKFHIYRKLRHQMLALEDSDLYEFSTEHFDEDSYRVIKGD